LILQYYGLKFSIFTTCAAESSYYVVREMAFLFVNFLEKHGDFSNSQVIENAQKDDFFVNKKTIIK
jgi:hypothetical protein